MRAVVLALAVVLLTTTAPGAARAEKPNATEAQAKKRFEKGTVFYNLGQFDDAIREYKAAYAIHPYPILLFNIAQAYRLKGDLEQALFFYRSYLRNMPKAPNRAEVLEQIATLEKVVTERQRAAAAPPPGVVSPGDKAPEVGKDASAAAPGLSSGAPQSAPAVTANAEATAPAPPPVTPAATRAAVAKAAPAPAPAVLVASPARASEDRAPPIYKRWWFWSAVGAVVVGAVVGTVAATSRSATLESDCTFGIGKLNCAKSSLR